MTNSVPKMSDKVERQISPSSGGKRHRRSASFRSSTYYASGGRYCTRGSSGGRLSLSPTLGFMRNSRSSPSRSESPRASPTSGFYAGAKFSEPPPPACLPKPPSHWTTRLMTSCQQSESRCSISNHLKLILKIQA